MMGMKRPETSLRISGKQPDCESKGNLWRIIWYILKLTNWKWLVGRCWKIKFPFGVFRPSFRGELAVGFRECLLEKNKTWPPHEKKCKKKSLQTEMLIFKRRGGRWVEVSLRKKSMTMENPPFEHVFPVEHRDFPACHVSFQGGLLFCHWFFCWASWASGTFHNWSLPHDGFWRIFFFCVRRSLGNSDFFCDFYGKLP